MVDRRRKMPVTILLKALGFTPEQILKEFFAFDAFHIEPKHVRFEVVPERLRGEVARFDINDKHGKVIVAKDKRITVKHIRDMESAGIKRIDAPDEFLLGRTVAHNVIAADTAEVLANANDEITETLLAKLREARTSKVQTLFTNDLDQGPYISQTLRADETADRTQARVAIYRMIQRIFQCVDFHLSPGADRTIRPLLVAGFQSIRSFVPIRCRFSLYSFIRSYSLMVFAAFVHLFPIRCRFSLYSFIR